MSIDGHVDSAATEIATFIDGRPIARLQFATILLCFATLIVDGLNLQMLAFTAPVILKQWNISAAELSPAMAASLIGMILGSALAGESGDRLGRRNTLLVSVGGFGLLTLATAWAPGVRSLAVLRFLSGIGFGGAIPNCYALASEWAPQRARFLVLGVLTAGPPLGGVFGALFSSWIIVSFGWRSCFIICAVITLLLVGAMTFVLLESATFTALRRGTGRAIALLRRVYGDAVSRIHEIGLLPPSAGSERGRPGIIGLMRGGEARMALYLVGAFFAIMFAVFSLTNWLPVALTTAGLSTTAALHGAVWFSFLFLAGTVGAGIALRKIGLFWSSGLGTVGSFGMMALLAHLLNSHHSDADLLPVYLALAGAGVFIGVVQSILFILASTAFSTDVRATSVGVCMMAGRVGGMLAVFAAGSQLTLHINALASYFGGLALAMLACGVMIGLFNNTRHGIIQAR